MGKTSKWIRNLLIGKKEKSKENIIQSECGYTSTIPGTPKEKRRWSFRRSSATAPPPQACAFTPKDSSPPPQPPPPPPPPLPQLSVVSILDNEDEQNKNVSAVEIEEIAAVKIQAFFRSHLARKALRALRGLVKLQALVRGHLVRKQATATLRCMQALITLQTKAREQRIRMLGDSTTKPTNPRTSIHKTRINNIYNESEENIKIVEMDIQSKMYSPAPSAITEMSPRAYSSHFEDCNSFNTAQSSPQCFRFKEYCNGDSLSSYDYPLFPNYMANTQSSKAKARSQSAPKQRPPEIYEKQTSGRRRASMEGPRNGVPRAVRMQRSSSQLGPTTTAKESQHHHHPHHQYYPWMAIKLDRSNISLMESECGSTSTVMTNTNYGRQVDVQGNMC
ncbi:Protein IQ-DOMAIN 19 [Cardamine amara subsp. amara]|uniref:Protein IQ-DOMAIN 19 n=1 Tax=Cardamine amara subsp. amara TaxID=228776 RepID=A0ABD1BTZ9_CARAN